MPTPALVALVAALAVVVLDHVLAAIPADRFPPGSTLQLVLHVARIIAAAVGEFLRNWRPPSGPAAGVAMLLLLLVALPARAGEPPQLAPTRAPLVLPMPPAPDLTPIPAQDLAAKLGLVRGQIDALALQLGAPLPKTLPPAFWDTTIGRAVTITLTVVGLGLAAAQTGVTIWQTVR